MMVRQNKWRSARFGLRAELVDTYTYEVRSAPRVVERLVERLRPAAAELGCNTYLEFCLDVANRPGWADRQRAMLRETGDPAELVRKLSDHSRITADFAPFAPLPVAGGPTLVIGTRA